MAIRRSSPCSLGSRCRRCAMLRRLRRRRSGAWLRWTRSGKSASARTKRREEILGLMNPCERRLVVRGTMGTVSQTVAAAVVGVEMAMEDGMTTRTGRATEAGRKISFGFETVRVGCTGSVGSCSALGIAISFRTIPIWVRCGWRAR